MESASKKFVQSVNYIITLLSMQGGLLIPSETNRFYGTEASLSLMINAVCFGLCVL